MQKAHDDDLVMSLVEKAMARRPDERKGYLEKTARGRQIPQKILALLKYKLDSQTTLL